MFKKQILWAGMVWSLGLASSSFGVVVGNWEGVMDGWSVENGGTASFSATGATLGSQALCADMPEPGSWRTTLKLQMNNDPLKTILRSNSKVSFDVTWAAADWVGGTWAKIEAVIVNGEAIGWNQLNLTAANDPANPSYPGSWDPTNWGAVHTRKITVDYSSVNFAPLDTLGRDPYWLELFVVTNYDGAFTQGGKYYFDNVEIFPEPSALALLGLGGLALVRRRRA